MQKRIGVSLDQGLLDELDEVRGPVPRSRWIQELVEVSLAAVRERCAGRAKT
jgi:metal-responsive CopG/Arc/MetJ family transcriptional regulator